MLTKHVKEMGWELVEVYQDEGTPYGKIPKSLQLPIISGFVGFLVIRCLQL
jgi:hypothetical protein